MKNCKVTINIRERDAALSASPKRWDDNGNELPDMPEEEFQALLDSLKGKTQFDIDMECNEKFRRIRSGLAPSELGSRETILKLTLYACMEALTKQFDNLCQ